jgi:hypothetical protein
MALLDFTYPHSGTYDGQLLDICSEDAFTSPSGHRLGEGAGESVLGSGLRARPLFLYDMDMFVPQ